MSVSAEKNASISLSDDKTRLVCHGDWVVTGIAHLPQDVKKVSRQAEQVAQLDASSIEVMDSAGALMLHDLIDTFAKLGTELKISGLKKRFLELYQNVSKEMAQVQRPLPQKDSLNFFYASGVWGTDKYLQAMSFLSFIGELWFTFVRSILNPRRIQWRSVLSAIDLNGYQALPIVALMTFLIGVVLAYEVAEQLKQYGADIFVVDITGIGIVREFGPLLTAIILAGRTSTAFAALIGTMKVNEEIDALSTMGLSPMDRLVFPRILGLLLVMPLLAVWADLFGVFGAMVMSKDLLNIGFATYLHRFEEAVGLKNYVLGMIKTPFFAMIIASVGCFQGFQVAQSAESVGYKTTKAAVQAIFLIIIVDASFSILFSTMGY